MLMCMLWPQQQLKVWHTVAETEEILYCHIYKLFPTSSWVLSHRQALIVPPPRSMPTPSLTIWAVISNHVPLTQRLLFTLTSLTESISAVIFELLRDKSWQRSLRCCESTTCHSSVEQRAACLHLSVSFPLSPVFNSDMSQLMVEQDMTCFSSVAAGQKNTAGQLRDMLSRWPSTEPVCCRQTVQWGGVFIRLEKISVYKEGMLFLTELHWKESQPKRNIKHAATPRMCCQECSQV